MGLVSLCSLSLVKSSTDNPWDSALGGSRKLQEGLKLKNNYQASRKKKHGNSQVSVERVTWEPSSWGHEIVGLSLLLKMT